MIITCRRTKRVCIVGLDGVGLNNIRIFLSEQILDGISSIVNKGYVYSFVSIPPYTPSAWTSIFTGVNPGKHGVYGFFKVSRGGTFKVSLASSYDVVYPRIFEMLSMYNLRSVAINVPLVYPVHGLVGLKNLVIVSDWASPKQFIYPQQYGEKYKEYLIEPPHRWELATNAKSYVRSVETFLEKRLNLYYELLEKENYSLFIVVFSELDWLMHRIPEIVEGRQLNLAYKVLSLIDRFVRRTCEICDLVVLVSDHGFTLSKLFIGVNSILANNGLINFKYKLSIGKPLYLKEQTTTSITRDGKRSLNPLSSQVFRDVLRNLIILAKKIIPQNILVKLGSAISVEIDYLRSNAFMLESGSWGVYVKEGYLDIVKKIFNSIEFVKKVLYKDEVFWGPHIEEAPDLILIPQNHAFFDTKIYVEPIYASYMGEHEPHALAAFYGDDVILSGDVGREATAMTICDLVPTILAYIGLPISSDADGKPIIDVFSIELPGMKRKFNYLQRFKMMRKLQGGF